MLGSGGDLRLQDDFTVEQLLTVLARLQGKDAEAKAYPRQTISRTYPQPAGPRHIPPGPRQQASARGSRTAPSVLMKK
jgi:hypothetical protein